MADSTSTYPAVGEIFELKLRYDDPAVDPMTMACRLGGHPAEWQWKGKRLSGIQTSRCKLVKVGRQLNLDAVKKTLTLSGEIPGGQWVEAFTRKYPQPDGEGPIGFADASWVSRGIPHFPTTHMEDSGWGFHWACRGDFLEHWRWLVMVPDGS